MGAEEAEVDVRDDVGPYELTYSGDLVGCWLVVLGRKFASVFFVSCEQVADGSAVEWKKLSVKSGIDECGEFDLAVRRGEWRWRRRGRGERAACDVAAPDLARSVPSDGSCFVYWEVAVNLA